MSKVIIVSNNVYFQTAIKDIASKITNDILVFSNLYDISNKELNQPSSLLIFDAIPHSPIESFHFLWLKALKININVLCIGNKTNSVVNDASSLNYNILMNIPGDINSICSVIKTLCEESLTSEQKNEILLQCHPFAFTKDISHLCWIALAIKRDDKLQPKQGSFIFTKGIVILKMISKGFSTNKISELTNMSIKAISYNKRKAMQRLGIKSTQEIHTFFNSGTNS